jgi:hypothetical protein
VVLASVALHGGSLMVSAWRTPREKRGHLHLVARAGGDGGAGGADAAIPAFPSCYGGCVTAADCGYGLAVNDADNYECRGGACVYTGCNSTAECVATYMSDDYGCGTVPGYPAPMCLHTCVTPGDCATASAAYDADNYRCTGGLCEYIGCRSDPECATLGNYGCHAFAGWIYPFCTQRCATAADCAVPTGGTLYDVDNYACEGGYCRWIGCHDAGECRDSLMDPDAVCRDVSGTGSP